MIKREKASNIFILTESILFRVVYSRIQSENVGLKVKYDLVRQFPLLQQSS